MARPQKYEQRTVEDLTHRRWCAMHTRVRSQERHKHATICEAWFDYTNFKRDLGECPEGYSLEREDNNKRYNPDNCKWIPLERQAKNRRCNIMLGARPLKEACELVGMEYKTVWYRVKKMGLDPLDAILYKQPLFKHDKIKEALK